MTLLTGVAVLRIARGHAPVRKSEMEAPSASDAAGARRRRATRTRPRSTMTPTGAIAQRAESDRRAVAAGPDGRRQPGAAALIAALPQVPATLAAAAATNGDIGAEVEIAQRYLEGRTVPRDPKVAARTGCRSAADAGSPSRNTGSARSTRRASASPATPARAREL